MSTLRGHPHLWLRRRERGPARFFIRDGDRMIGTGCLEHEKVRAEEKLQEYRFRADEDNAIGFIYFITAIAPDYPIKIGFTGTLNQIRLRSLQTGSPFPLYRIGHIRGSVRQERGLHQDFAHLRMMGEWFKRDPGLVAYV